MKFEKMVKIAKALNKMFTILQRLIVICAAAIGLIVGVFTVIVFLNPDFPLRAEPNVVDIGSFTFTLGEVAIPDNSAVMTYAWIIAVAAVAYITVMWFLLGLVRKILEPMTEGKPFDPLISREIRKLAFFSLAIGVISNVFSAIDIFVDVHLFDLYNLLQNSQVQSIRANFNFDVTFVIAFFVLLLVSYIFQYGEELQKLSDETL